MRVSGSAAKILFVVFGLSLVLPLQVAPAQAQKAVGRYEEKKRQTNDIALSVIVSGITCTCARFAEDIRNIVNDLRPDGLRILPVLGVGGLQNLSDVLFLKGIDMGVVDEDNLSLLKQRDPALYVNVEQSVQYITKLYDSEFQVLARNDIKSYDDLRGKRVNFNLKDSQTEVSADIIFNFLKINVQRTNYDNDEAIKRVKNGDLAAMIILTGAPQAAFAKLTKADGVHFLSLDEQSLPNHDVSSILAKYMPTELTHKQYPELIPEDARVPTIANRALLVTYAWPERSLRYNRVAKFVREFFGKIDQFRDGARHPKWDEVALSAEVPGWVRFKPAAEWIAQHRAVAMNPTVERFIQSRAATALSEGDKTALSERDKEALIEEFRQYLGSSH